MNKKEIIKFIFVLLVVIVSFNFMLRTEEIGLNSMFNMLNIINFFLALTIFMFYNMKRIKKFKFIYDVILLLLIVFSTLVILYILYISISCLSSVNCSMEDSVLFIALYPTILFLMLLFSFNDIFHKTNKINYILTIILATIILLIHLRYYFDPNFINNVLDGDLGIQYSYVYVVQNYVYFIIMYIVILSQKIINKKN